MKTTLYVLAFLIFLCNGLKAQRRIDTRTRPAANQTNLLDMPGYKKPARAFVPFVADANAARKGYKADSIYSWIDGAGKRQRAKGSEILQQLNDLEKALSERGHSLRDAKPFEGLTLQFPRDYFKRSLTVPPSFVSAVDRKNPLSPKVNTSRPPKIKKGNLSIGMAGYLYPYFGNIEISNEFPGRLYDEQVLKTISANPNKYSLPLVLPFTPSTFSKLETCVLEIYNNSGKTGTPLLSIPVNIKSPEKKRAWSNELQLATENPVSDPSGLWLYFYNVSFADVNKLIPAPNRSNNYYYVSLKFGDKSGNPMLFSFQNEIRINNTQLPPLHIADNIARSEIKAIDYELSNQGFGFYIRSNGFSPNTNTEYGTYYDEKINSSFTADFSVGIQYYNFDHLLDDNAPASRKQDIMQFSFSANRQTLRPDVEYLAPPIRQPGKAVNDPYNRTEDLMANPSTLFDVTILNKKTKGYSDNVNLFHQSFMIGPVPCFADIFLVPDIKVDARGTYTTAISSDRRYISTRMEGNITPNLNLSVRGSGGAGVDGLLWAKVNVDVGLMNLQFPITFDIQKGTYANASASAVISSLSGKVSFDAGICIPIPFFDDICKSFSIPIAKWDAPVSSNYIITPSGEFK